MLIHLKLDKFKIWKTTGPIRLAPITLLLGTNSSGKSSLIQSLLLIRQTVKGDDPNLDLNFGDPDAGDSVTLGRFTDVVTHRVYGNQIGIEFSWSKTGEVTDSYIFSAHYSRGHDGLAVLADLHLGRGRQGFTVKHYKENTYRLWVAGQSRMRGQSEHYRPQRSFAFSAAALERLEKDGIKIDNVGPQLLDELSRIIYLGPVRRLAQRDYVWSGRMPSTIGDDGGKAVDALIASGVARSAGKKGRATSPEADLITGVEAWLKRMDLADELIVRQLGRSSRYELLVKHQGEISNIKDVGVGVSQVLPVIVAALHAAPGHIVIVEEPESHLHPLAETVLADLFGQISKQRNVQFIIETHSEHLLNRLQRRIAEGMIDKTEIAHTDVAMYFCKRNEDKAILEPLILTPEGDIENWPENFFGDEMADLTARTVAAMKRRTEDDHS